MNHADHLRLAPVPPTFSWRMRLALLLSVAIHALLLSIPIDGDVLGMPGLRMPWEERRLTASDLQVVLAPLPVASPVIAPAPVAPATVPAPTPQPTVEVEPRVVMSPAPAPAEPAPSPPAPAPAPAPKVADAPVVTPDPLPAPRAEDARRAQLEEEAGARIIALENARREQAFQVEQQRKADRIAAARLEQDRLAQLAAAEQQRQADLTALTQAQAQAREQAARDELTRAEAARVEAERQTQARLAQQEAARQEAARQEAMRQDAARQAQAQAQAQQAQQAQAQQAQAQQAPARPALSAQEAQREERLRAIGRQLNQEAAQRDAANGPPGTPLPQVSGQRRGWLVGRADPNTELITYAQAMGRKIELNMTIDTVRDAARQPHRQPVVTVAVRSDGSVERVTFVTSSGVPAIDEAIRKIVASQAPFGPFPPALARQYDVVEIRRTWIFDVAVRLE